jgi:hypothetical protein
VHEVTGPDNASSSVDALLQKGEDPSTIIPIEAARASLMHWWREPVAGICALGIGCWDVWHFGRDAGLTSSLDEILIIGGIVLVAGSKRLFGGTPPGEK